MCQFGATEQNVLKLFEWIMENPESRVQNEILKPEDRETKIIY